MSLKALDMKHYNNTQPNLIITHSISHSIPPHPHIHTCTQSRNPSRPLSPSLLVMQKKTSGAEVEMENPLHVKRCLLLS